MAKREIDNSIIEYDNNKNNDKSLKMIYLKDNLSRCIDDIFTTEQMMKELPERLAGLLEMKKELESEICWLEYGNN